MSKIGICPGCNRSAKTLEYRHPETGQIICYNCYQEAIRNFILKKRKINREVDRKIDQKKKVGICSSCDQGPKYINYRHPQTKKPICPNCYNKIKRGEERLANPRPVKIQKPVIRKVRGKNLYPTKESVIKALEARIKNGKQNCAATVFSEDATLYRRARQLGIVLPKKEVKRRKPVEAKRIVLPGRIIEKGEEDRKGPEREAKYPTRELAIAALELREAQGKENFSDVLSKEDDSLYNAVLSFGVELPTKENPPIEYYRGDLVRNQNPKYLGICGLIGQVVLSNKKEVIVDFKEPNKVKRVYLKWYNLNNIALHARHPSNLAKITQKEASRPDKKSGLFIFLDFFLKTELE